MNRGRPIGSIVRQNIVEILYVFKSMHGYDIHKKYLEYFPKITLRTIYYHLRKGLATKEFKISKIEKKQGDYSWGQTVENIVYELDKNAKPQGILKV
jgi:hypothetical protein